MPSKRKRTATYLKRQNRDKHVTRTRMKQVWAILARISNQSIPDYKKCEGPYIPER